MPFGRPGDHPFTDLLNHGRNVYGLKTDQLIIEIHKEVGLQKAYDWWSLVFCKHENDSEKRHQMAVEKLQEIRSRS